jgi:hypothetical protein
MRPWLNKMGFLGYLSAREAEQLDRADRGYTDQDDRRSRGAGLLRQGPRRLGRPESPGDMRRKRSTEDGPRVRRGSSAPPWANSGCHRVRASQGHTQVAPLEPQAV